MSKVKVAVQQIQLCRYLKQLSVISSEWQARTFHRASAEGHGPGAGGGGKGSGSGAAAAGAGNGGCTANIDGDNSCCSCSSWLPEIKSNSRQTSTTTRTCQWRHECVGVCVWECV